MEVAENPRESRHENTKNYEEVFCTIGSSRTKHRLWLE